MAWHLSAPTACSSFAPENLAEDWCSAEVWNRCCWGKRQKSMCNLGCPWSSYLIMPVALASAHCVREEQVGKMCWEETRKRKRQGWLKAVERTREPRSYKLGGAEGRWQVWCWGTRDPWVWVKSGTRVTGWVLGGKGPCGTVWTWCSEEREAAAQGVGGIWGLTHQARLRLGWDFERLQELRHNDNVGWSLSCKGCTSSPPMLFIRDLQSYWKVMEKLYMGCGEGGGERGRKVRLQGERNLLFSGDREKEEEEAWLQSQQPQCCTCQKETLFLTFAYARFCIC